MINFMIIYNVVNIFSMKNYKSSRKLRVGVNWYPGVNWSTTTSLFMALNLYLKDAGYVNWAKVLAFGHDFDCTL